MAKQPKRPSRAVAQIATGAMTQSGKDESMVSISQAAQILGVSIDTVRRWDRSGVLHSVRPDGKNRYFTVEELEQVKFSQPLTISEASEQLGISTSTLRRMEEKGWITPERNDKGERLYNKETLEKFLHSEYFLRQREVQEEILEPLSGPQQSSPYKEEDKGKGHDPVAHMLLGEHHTDLKSLKKFKKLAVTGGAVLLASFFILIALITILFFLFPDATSKSLGYFKKKPGSKKFIFQPADSLLARQLKPFSQTALTVVEAVNPDLRNRVAPKGKIKDVNDIFSPDSEGNISSTYTFTVPDTSYLKIPDQGLVQNLNSDYLRGLTPGCDKGNLAVVGSCAGVGGSNVGNNTTGSGSGGGFGAGGDITEVNAGVGLTGGGDDGSVSLAVLVNATGSGLEVSTSGVSLGRSCISGEILKWNGSGWNCATDSGGGNSFETISTPLGSSPVADSTTDTLLLSSDAALTITGNSASDALAFALDVDTAGATGTTSANSGLEVSGSGLRMLGGCASGQILKWNGSVWNCAADSIGSSAGGSIDVRETDGTPLVSPAAILEFGPVSSSSNEFVITDQGGGVARVGIGTQVGMLNQAETVASLWTFSGGLACSDCISLGSETTGDYLASLSSGSGLVVTGIGESAAATINLDVAVDGVTSGFSSASGLEVDTTGDTGLRLLGGCSTNQILKWNGTVWICSADNSGGGSQNLFLEVAGDTGGSAIADSTTDILSLLGGNGIVSDVTAGSDTLTFNIDLTTAGTVGSTATNSGLEIVGNQLSLLKGCADGRVLKWDDAGAVWTCGIDAGAGVAPFGTSGGIIDKTTASDRLRLQYGDSGDVQLEIENTTSGTVPITDAVQLNLSGGGGVIADGVDGLYINIEGGNGASNTVSALHLNFDPIDASGDETFIGMQIDGIVQTAASEKAIQIGSGWDVVLDSGSVDIFGNGNVTGVANLTTSGTVQLTGYNCSVSAGFANGGALTTDASGNVICSNDDGGSGVIWSALTDPTSSLSLNHNEFATNFTWDASGPSDVLDALTLNYQNDGTSDSGAQRLLVLRNSALSTQITDRLLVLDNADDGTVPTGLEILGSATGAITTAIDVDDAEIGTAISFGANDISGTSFSVAGATGDVTSGLINGQTITSVANFTGTVTVATSVTSPVYTGTGSVQYTAGGVSPTITIGGANVDSLIVTTNSTGNSEVQLPNESIGSLELADNSITSTDIQDNTIQGIDILDDTLDWNKFVDAMSLDASTTIASTQAATSLDLNLSPAGSATTPIALEITPTWGIAAADQRLIALNINPNTNGNGDSGDELIGINIESLAAASGSKTALFIGSGWDTSITAAGLIDTQGALQTGISNVTLTNLNGFIQAGAYEAASIDGDDINASLAGKGLVLTGGSPDQLDIDLIGTVPSVGANASNSGLAFDSTVAGAKLGLIQGCSNLELLKWFSGISSWQCSADVSAGSPTLDSIAAALSNSSAKDSNDNTVNWNWDFQLAGVDSGLKISESSASTAGSQDQQALFEIVTLSTSTASPLQVTAGGADQGDIWFDLTGASDFFIRDNGIDFVEFTDNGNITLGKASAAQTINIGIGSGVDTINIGTGSGSASAVTIGNTVASAQTTVQAGSGGLSLGATSGDIAITTTTSGNISLTPAAGSDVIISEAAGSNVQITATAAPSVDMVAISNSGFGSINGAVDGLQIDFVTSSTGGAQDNAGLRINITSGATISTDTLEGITIGGLTSAGSGLESALQIGTSWDREINFTDTSAVVSIADGGTVSLVDGAGGNTLVTFKDSGVAGENWGILNLDGKATTGNPAGSCTLGDIYFNSSDKTVMACTEATATGWEQLDNPETGSAQESTSDGLTNAMNAIISATITPGFSGNDNWISVSSEIATDVAETVTLRIVRGSNCAANQIGGDMVYDLGAADDLVVAFSFVDTANTGVASTTYSLCAQKSLAVGSNVNAADKSIVIYEITNGADLAEIYYSSDITLKPGEVVAVDQSLRAGVRRATAPYQQDVLGIVSTKPGYVLGDGSDAGYPVLVALAGRVPVKVSSENGPIKVGDMLSTGSKPGVAMKATKAGTVIGKAMTEFSGTGEGSVMVFVGTSSWGGSFSGELLTGLSLEGLEVGTLILEQLASLETALVDLEPVSELYADRIVAGLELIAPKVTTRELATDSITAATADGIDINLSSGGLSIKGEGGQSVASFDSIGNADFGGTVSAKQVRTEQIVGADLGEQFGAYDKAVEVGDVVVLDPNASSMVKKSDSPYAKGLVGVVTSGTSLVVDGGAEAAHSVIVALAGTVSVKVSGENGPISPGDPLTSSSTPGIAMKATNYGSIIGRAASSYDGTEVGNVLVVVSASYGGSIADELAALSGRVTTLESEIAGLKSATSQPTDLTNLKAEQLSVVMDLSVGGGMIVSGDATFKGLTVFEKLATFIGKTIFRQDVEFDGHIAVASDTAGLALIRIGETKVQVKFDRPYTEMPIVSVSLGDGKFASYSYANLTNQGFEIVLEHPATNDLRFSWIALAGKAPKLAENPQP